jgi:RNA polymerase sigma-70 factor (ECF subfamily)
MSDQSDQFRVVYDAYRPRILRYLTRLVGQAEAEDLTQDVLIKVSKGLGQFRGDSGLSTWIYRIATNSALDRLRRPTALRTPDSEYVMTTELGDDTPGEEHGRIEEAGPSVEAGVIRMEMNQCILEFVHRLPENYRTALLLSELEGFTNSEIADIVGVSLDAVKIRLHRAREKLRRELSTGCNFHRDERNEFACGRKSETPPPRA